MAAGMRVTHRAEFNSPNNEYCSTKQHGLQQCQAAEINKQASKLLERCRCDRQLGAYASLSQRDGIAHVKRQSVQSIQQQASHDFIHLQDQILFWQQQQQLLLQLPGQLSLQP